MTRPAFMEPIIAVLALEAFGYICSERPLAQRTIPEPESQEEPALAHNSSTNNLIRRY
jgi:hypothetical protein